MKKSRFGLGCMNMNFSNEKKSIKTIHRALDLGINLLNTGDFYSSGESEMIIGKGLQGISRDKYEISVKFGLQMAPDRKMYGLDVHPDRIKNNLTSSLKRLRLDYVDLYQPCRMDASIPVEDIIIEISKLVKEGYVKNIGISEIDSETLKRADAVHPIKYVEMDYSLLNRNIETDLISTAREFNINLVAFGIIARAKINEITSLQEIVKEKNVSVFQLAYAWVLNKGKDIIPLIGTTNEKHLEELVYSQNIVLSDEDIKRVENTIPLEQRQYAGGMGNITFKNGRITDKKI